MYGTALREELHSINILKDVVIDRNVNIQGVNGFRDHFCECDNPMHA